MTRTSASETLPRNDPEELGSAWRGLLASRPGIRTRAAADELGVSEAELLASRRDAGARRIDPDLRRILPHLEALGEMMALTRNDVCVHEKVGVYRNVRLGDHVAQVLDDRIDLRLFPGRFRHGFDVRSRGKRGELRSLQFFDASGVAVHKTYVRDGTDVDAYEALVEELLLDDRTSPPAIEPPSSRSPERPDVEVDAEALAADWRALGDTHDFVRLLREHDVSRTQALRLVPAELARPASNGGLRAVLETAAEEGIELMVFVRSPAVIQIHHGAVHRVADSGPWLNVLDPGFDLHVREDLIASTWVVRKPADEGWVTSVELFDAEGRECALLFGCRDQGAREDRRWRELARGLPALAGAARD